jgi:hypothetical protein
MSIVKTSTMKTTADAATATELPMLTPKEAIELLRGLRQRIPEFVQLPKDAQTDHYRRVARLNPEFSHEAFSAVGASDLVQHFIGNTPDELHQAEDEAARWAGVRSELRALLRGVDSAILVRRQRIGLAALQAYTVSLAGEARGAPAPAAVRGADEPVAALRPPSRQAGRGTAAAAASENGLTRERIQAVRPGAPKRARSFSHSVAIVSRIRLSHDVDWISATFPPTNTIRPSIFRT